MPMSRGGESQSAGHPGGGQRQNVAMPDTALSAERPSPRPVRDVADAYVTSLADLNPMLATRLGLNPGDDRLPDASPAGQQARDDLARSTLADLDAAERPAGASGAAGRARALGRQPGHDWVSPLVQRA